MNFSANIAKFVQRTKLSTDLVLRKVALDGFVGVTKRSPVRTGRFRGSWRIGINRVDDTVNEVVSTETPGSLSLGLAGEELGKATAALAAAHFGDTIHITNNLPYAERIENGWSDQAPQGVLALTFEELKENISKLVAQVEAGNG